MILFVPSGAAGIGFHSRACQYCAGNSSAAIYGVHGAQCRREQ